MRIIQISCSYLPDRVGGTEVYVHNLSKALINQGHEVLINYVDEFYERQDLRAKTEEYTFEGLPVFVIEKNTFKLKTAQLYFDRVIKVYQLFKDYIRKVKPDIIHFHHFSPTDIISHMQAAKEMHIPIILTYHTPMMTCGHSDMLYLGERVCEGRIDKNRCLVCSQVKYGLPLPLAYLWANFPEGLTDFLGSLVSQINFKSRFATWLQFPWLTRKRIDRWKMGLEMIDHFVAVCRWGYNLLLKNNIPAEKISLCRHGMGQIPSVIKKDKDNILRLGYLGRIHPVKGIDVLLKAFELLPSHYQIELYIYGLSDGDRYNKYYAGLKHKFYKDKRIKWLDKLNEKDKFQALGQLDIVIIPSRWLETGPLVLLEAWSVGTPVIGARLGGIAELLVNGAGGLLFNSEDASDLARAITHIYREPDLIERLRERIPKVRTMNDVADQMQHLYEQIIK